MPPTYKSPSGLTWPTTTELIGLRLRLQPEQNGNLYPQYPIGLHAWFLDQVRQTDPDLSARLHDNASEKPFTLSALQGLSLKNHGEPLCLCSHSLADGALPLASASQSLLKLFRYTCCNVLIPCQF